MGRYANEAGGAAESDWFEGVLDGQEEDVFGLRVLYLLHGSHPLLVQFFGLDCFGDVHEEALFFFLALRVEGLGLEPHQAQTLVLVLVLL